MLRPPARRFARNSVVKTNGIGAAHARLNVLAWWAGGPRRVVKGHRTSSFPAPSRVAERAAGRLSLEAYREILDLVPSPSVVLDEHGFVVECNRAFADLLQAREPTLIGEPLLAWIHSTAETGAFGRAFQGLRSRPPGHDFLLELTLTSAVGPIACGVQGRKLSSGHVLVTCASAEVREPSPERDMGNAIKRSLEALDQGMLLLDGHGQIVHANPA
ncbi:MAG: PAS domain-containing protein, partial [Myxococcales bacterium]|nr:PAS domain-containing protein [Myxococcales bacterium]